MINKGLFKYNIWQGDLNITWVVDDEYYINTGKEIADILSKRDEIYSSHYTKEKTFTYLNKHHDKLFLHSLSIEKVEPVFNNYKPPEFKDLFLRFAYININNNNEIFDFINNFGLPGIELYYPLDKIKKDIKKANELISIYEKIVHNKIKELRNIIEVKNEEGNMIWRFNRKEFNNQLNESEVISLFLSYIQRSISNILNNNIVPVFKKLEYDLDDCNHNSKELEDDPGLCNQHFKVLPGWSCKSLLAFMYLQFYFFITENKRMGICEFCGKPFEMDQTTRSDKKYHDKCRKKAWYHKNKKK